MTYNVFGGTLNLTLSNVTLMRTTQLVRLLTSMLCSCVSNETLCDDGRQAVNVKYRCFISFC